MTAKDILEQISGILDDDSMDGTAKIYEIKDIVVSEAVETPFCYDRYHRLD